jgi:hypothetical protein
LEHARSCPTHFECRTLVPHSDSCSFFIEFVLPVAPFSLSRLAVSHSHTPQRLLAFLLHHLFCALSGKGQNRFLSFISFSFLCISCPLYAVSPGSLHISPPSGPCRYFPSIAMCAPAQTLRNITERDARRMQSEVLESDRSGQYWFLAPSKGTSEKKKKRPRHAARGKRQQGRETA